MQFPDSVKIGMVSSGELIDVIADRLKYYNAKNIVVDPVMVATSGSELMKTDAVQTLIEELLPIAEGLLFLVGDEGITEEQIHTLLVENPADWLLGKE